MPRNKAEGFGERIAEIRHRFGSRGADTNRSEFARELGIKPGTYGFWERKDYSPRQRELAESLRRIESVHDPEGLAAWATTGVGDKARLFGDDAPPSGAGAGSARLPADPVHAGAIDDAVLDELGQLAQEAALASASSGVALHATALELVRRVLTLRDQKRLTGRALGAIALVLMRPRSRQRARALPFTRRRSSSCGGC